MTNSLAIWLVLIILAAFGVDYVLFDFSASIFLGRKGVDLLQWLAFWR